MKEKDNDLLWYKDAIIYQLHVQSFFDSNGDGTGDFKGLVTKLGYLKNLGVTALWLLPFYPSPLKDGGYDISDFTNIHLSYGNFADFKKFIQEAHRLGLKVITELVLNHTSNEHYWYKRAQIAKPGSSYRNFYVWNDNPEKFLEARIIFKDFETSNWSYDPKAKSYYWHRFYSHQPDLNFDNPNVHRAMLQVLDFWFDAGVDGLRLDAVPYLYEREGTNCENLPETHEFLKKMRSYVDKKYKGKMLLAEANQWPEDASRYFGNGDECHMAFHFPVMPRLFMGLRMEDRFPIIDILEQTPEIPSNCQWAIFLRNHDELTLEMVTDEERDYMYKSFALDPKQRINLGIRRRLAPLLDADRRKIELMNFLLFSLPGTPIVYYGDEIGMGDNFYLGDRYGVRTPMQWSSDKNAGFSKSSPQKLFLPIIIEPEYHYEAINVENQEKNPSSLLWWMKRVIAMRKKYLAFSRGTLNFINSGNPKVLAFIRKHEDEVILVVANLSRYTQLTHLDLSEYKGYIPKELFSRTDFPAITGDDYIFPIRLKDYYWFKLYMPVDQPVQTGEAEFNINIGERDWNIFNQEIKNHLENEILINYIKNVRWFMGKAKTIQSITIQDQIPIYRDENGLNSHLLIVTVDYLGYNPESYIISVSIAKERETDEILMNFPKSVIARVSFEDEKAIIYDSSISKTFHKTILDIILNRKKEKGKVGSVVGSPGKLLRDAARNNMIPKDSKLISAEQSNSSVIYEDKFFLKFYRRYDEGHNPEVEIIKNLTDNSLCRNIPSFAGELEYQKHGAESSSICILTDFQYNEGNAWQYAQTQIDYFFENIISARGEINIVQPESFSIYQPVDEQIKEKFFELTGYFFPEMIQLLGKRTAELHKALIKVDTDDFRPEPYSLLYQKSVYQSIRSLIRRTITEIKTLKGTISAEIVKELGILSDNESAILDYIKNVLEQRKLDTIKARIHGDYHLGQVLFTGKDFIIIDFEGEPTRPISTRRLKYCPLRDVAGMVRSFHYAIYGSYFSKISSRPEDTDLLKKWPDLWYANISSLFIQGYLKKAGDAVFMPPQRDFENLLNVFLIEKAVYEIAYEINNRPAWAVIPLKGITDIINLFIKR